MHFMSSCQGELANEKFEVKAVDQSGTVLLNETVMTLPNGFMELWLPRNRKIELTIKQNELLSIGVIDTFGSSKTCVTTFKLQ